MNWHPTCTSKGDKDEVQSNQGQAGNRNGCERRDLIIGSAVTTPALFTINEYHTTYGALSVLVAIPVFLAIAYKVFKRDEVSEPVSQSHRKGQR